VALTNVEPATPCHNSSELGSAQGLNAVFQLSPTGSLLAEDMDELGLKGTLQTLELGGVDVRLPRTRLGIAQASFLCSHSIAKVALLLLRASVDATHHDVVDTDGTFMLGLAGHGESELRVK